MASKESKIKELDDWSDWHTSTKTMVSYSFGAFGFELVGNAFAGLYFFFYETELLLPGIFLIVANVIFAVWNAVNDPIMGYIVEKPKKWWGKYGKRFPWIATMLIPMYISYFLLFAPPLGMGPFAYFLWMTVMLCLADTFYSAFFTAWYGMFPEKYRTDAAKRKGNVYKLVFSILSVIIGTLIPPEIYKFDVVESYAEMAAVILLIGVVAGLIVIYGAREDPARKALEVQQGMVPQDPFLKSLKTAVTNKAFLAYIFFYFGNKTWDLFVIGSVPYYAKWILGIPAGELTLIYIFFILGQFIAVPIFTWVAKKVGFYKTAVIGGFLESACTLPLMFITDFDTAVIFILIVGIGNAALWSMLAPILSEALDSLAVQTGKRDSGVYVGIYIFFGRLAIIVFTFLMVFVHDITGFNAAALPGKGVQTPLADFGIILTIGIIPLIATALFTFLFAITYDIKGEKKEWLEKQLREQDLHK